VLRSFYGTAIPNPVIFAGVVSLSTKPEALAIWLEDGIESYFVLSKATATDSGFVLLRGYYPDGPWRGSKQPDILQPKSSPTTSLSASRWKS
jgi:hypothetical protein